VPGLVILRPESPLFFANADAVRDAIEAAAARDGVRGVQLLVAREIGQARDVLRRAGPGEPTLRFYPTVRAAVEAFDG